MNPSIRLEVVKNRITNMEPGERLLLCYGPGQKTNLISRLSNLSHQIKIHSAKEQHPKNSAAITCTHCQQTVWQSHAINRRINTCDCLTAIFSPPYVELSSKEWTQCTQWSSQSALQDGPTQILRIRDHHDYAEDQADESPVGLDPNHPPINQNQINTQLCRCAFCELPDQEAAVTYPWYRTASQFPASNAARNIPETHLYLQSMRLLLHGACQLRRASKQQNHRQDSPQLAKKISHPPEQFLPSSTHSVVNKVTNRTALRLFILQDEFGIQTAIHAQTILTCPGQQSPLA